MLRTLQAVLFLWIMASPLASQDSALPDVVVIFDFVGGPGIRKNPSYAFAVREGRDDADLLGQLRNAASNPANAADLLEAIRVDRTAATDLRAFSRRGDIVEVFAFHRSPSTVNFDFDEVRRSTRLATDMGALIRVAALVLQRQAALDTPQDPTLRVSSEQYLLTEPRATVTVKATLQRPEADDPRRPAPVQCAPPQQAGGEGSNPGVIACVVMPGSTPSQGARTDSTASGTTRNQPNSPTVTLTTGPSEHFFLSANAGAAAISRLSYDKDSESLQPAEAPTSFFVGVNYALGDLYLEPERRLDKVIMSGLYVGAMVEASRRPMDQVAIVGGLRRNPISFLAPFLSFDIVSPFAGVLWARSDQIDDEGNVTRGGRYGKGQFVWGANLNLGRAVDWLTPKKDGGGKAAQGTNGSGIGNP